MAIPFTVDISAFYGEPDFREQDSGTIVDQHKTLNLHKELETPINTPKRKKRSWETRCSPTRSAGAISFGQSEIAPGGAIGFNETGGAIGFKDNSGGAIGLGQSEISPRGRL